jgi:hypothetical protein
VWAPIYAYNRKIKYSDFEQILEGEIPGIVIKNFYSENQCDEILKKIKEYEITCFEDSKLEHIGPFLMSYTTRKEKYLYKSKEFKKTTHLIFEKVENPFNRINKLINLSLPSFSISIARESERDMSPFVIRVHRKGKSIPIHKDNVNYEGKEYSIADIEYQLSCVIHLQESEFGGDVIIYKNKWNRKHEKYRNIDFGYSSQVASKESCKIEGIEKGDLVIINPNYFHQVTEILGEIPRITLGMFLGIYQKDQRIVVWA